MLNANSGSFTIQNSSSSNSNDHDHTNKGSILRKLIFTAILIHFSLNLISDTESHFFSFLIFSLQVLTDDKQSYLFFLISISISL